MLKIEYRKHLCLTTLELFLKVLSPKKTQQNLYSLVSKVFCEFMVNKNKTVGSKQRKRETESLANLITLIKELELAICLSPALSPRQAKQLQSAIFKLVKQI